MVDLVTNRKCIYRTTVKVLKGVSARHQGLWSGHLWSLSYYVGTAGTVSAATIQRYKRARHFAKRR